MAAIDRVLHHSVILDMMDVESFRALEASARQQENRPVEAGVPASR